MIIRLNFLIDFYMDFLKCFFYNSFYDICILYIVSVFGIFLHYYGFKLKIILCLSNHLIHLYLFLTVVKDLQYFNIHFQLHKFVLFFLMNWLGIFNLNLHFLLYKYIFLQNYFFSILTIQSLFANMFSKNKTVRLQNHFWVSLNNPKNIIIKYQNFTLEKNSISSSSFSVYWYVLLYYKFFYLLLKFL